MRSRELARERPNDASQSYVGRIGGVRAVPVARRFTVLGGLFAHGRQGCAGETPAPSLIAPRPSNGSVRHLAHHGGVWPNLPRVCHDFTEPTDLLNTLTAASERRTVMFDPLRFRILLVFSHYRDSPMGSRMDSDIMTIREVAEYLKLTEKTAYRHAADGKIPGFKVGGAWRFRRGEIDKWIEQQSAEREKRGEK